jgi:hypothetical protein
MATIKDVAKLAGVSVSIKTKPERKDASGVQFLLDKKMKRFIIYGKDIINKTFYHLRKIRNHFC